MLQTLEESAKLLKYPGGMYSSASEVCQLLGMSLHTMPERSGGCKCQALKHCVYSGDSGVLIQRSFAGVLRAAHVIFEDDLPCGMDQAVQLL